MGHWKTSFEKNWVFFCVGEYAEYGFDQQRLIWYVCPLWDMGYLTGDKHTISTFVDQTHIKMGQLLLHNHNKVLCLNDVEMSPCCY